MTKQLRLLNGGELPGRAPRARRTPTARAARPTSAPVLRLDARTREIGQSGVAEARRVLAEILATTERAQDLVRAS